MNNIFLIFILFNIYINILNTNYNKYTNFINCKFMYNNLDIYTMNLNVSIYTITNNVTVYALNNITSCNIKINLFIQNL